MPSFSAKFPLLVFALGLVAACSQPVPYDLRRIAVDGRPDEPIEAGGVARPGLTLQPDQRGVSVDLSAMTAGRATIFAAPAGDAVNGGGVDIEFRETGWRSWTGTSLRERCSLRWGAPGTPVDAPWQPCTFDLARAVQSARLEVTRHGGTEGEILVSELQLEGGASRRLPNVFILLLDAARFDGLRPFHASAGAGNNLEALARDSVVLRNLHSSSSWTRPAVATLFTGLRADRHRVLDRGDVLSREVVTLAEMLSGRGYSTAAWSTNPNVLPVWGFAQGFDAFVDQGSHSWTSGKTDGNVVVSRIRAALASRGTAPLFYYAHLMDPHAPYQPSKAQREAALALPNIKSLFPRPMAIWGAPRDWEAFVDYTGELFDSDDHVGAFVETLKAAGVYDDSLVLVVADHGEEFIDHGGRDHGHTLYEEVLHVPAMIKLPGNRRGGTVIDQSLSMVDLLPTMLAGIDMDTPPGLDGVAIDFDAKPGDPPRPQVASLNLDGRRQSAILDPPWKLIRTDLRGGIELYNLVEDPLERSNKEIWHPDVVARLKTILDKMMSHGQEGWHVLLCGTLEETVMDVLVHPSSGTLEPFGFQDGEATPSTEVPGAWRLRPTLTPVEIERAAFGQMLKVTVPEQAELQISPDPAAAQSTFEILAPAGSPIMYRTGPAGTSRSATRIILDSNSADVRYAQAAQIECNPATKAGVEPPPATNPFLRVWYVPPVTKVDTDTLDPLMRERLRALGYLQ